MVLDGVFLMVFEVVFLSLGIQIPSKKVVWGVFRRLNTISFRRCFYMLSPSVSLPKKGQDLFGFFV